MSTILWDKGEEQWQSKLHLGCGSVYLKGYTNIDIQGHAVAIPESVPEDNVTTVDKYYKFNGDVDHIPEPRKTFVDRKSGMTNTGLPTCSVDKILCIQALEHLSSYDAKTSLVHWWNILKKDGVLVLSVPDTTGTLELLRNEPAETVIRLLGGSLKDSHASHLSWFTEDSLINLLTETGFYRIELLPNIHFYPAIVLRCYKHDGYVADRSYQDLPEIGEVKRVLDIGPGNFPFALATEVLDKIPRPDLEDDGLIVHVVDLDDVPYLPWPDGHFDFVYASHVAEHLKDPVGLIQEMQRIGKAGYVEVPSVMKDMLFQFGGTGHGKWNCLRGDLGEIVFSARHPGDQALFADGFTHFGQYNWIVTHMERTLTDTEIALRNFFWDNQLTLNIGAYWDKSLDLVAKARAFKDGEIWET